MRDFIAVMRRLAEEGRRRDPGCDLFGAVSHAWRFKPPARLEEVRELESDLNIKLPGSLVRYLTELGNGGCGPDYGIYSLSEMRKESDWLPQYADAPLFLTPDLTKRQWAEFVRGYDAFPDETAEEAEQYLARMTAGTVAVSTPGCTMQTLVICEGKHAGEVVIVDFDMTERFPPRFCGRFDRWCTEQTAAALK